MAMERERIQIRIILLLARLWIHQSLVNLSQTTINMFQASLPLQFLCFLITITLCTTNNPIHHTPDVSINCGSTGPSATRAGREWLGDSLTLINGLSTASTAILNPLSVDPIPYRTARISRTRFSYAFQVNPGQKIIRLHFNPSPYRGFKRFKDLFTVEACHFTLLANFSATLTAESIFTKEFFLTIHENQQLVIVFSPEDSPSLDSYAFVNGIEIISVPASLSYFHGGDIGLRVVGQKSLDYVDHSTAIEIMQRINIKQNHVSFPKWEKRKGDTMKESSWKIPVQVGFRYLIRLHFSKIGLRIAFAGSNGDLIFKVLINEETAHTNIDLLEEMDEDDIVLYRDYMVMMRGLKRDSNRDLLISLQSYDELIDGHVVLAGFEILKLSNPDNSLASPNPPPPPVQSPSLAARILLSILSHRYATSTVAITMISLLNIVVHKLRETWEARNNTMEENKPSARAALLCRRFSLSEMQLATRNFNEGLLIGKGGFGKVYKGLIDKGKKTVALKRLKSNSKQGAHEFLTEIETLSELRHINLVSLIGYCSEHGEMILVYEYMARGTLADHLYKLPRHSSNCVSLTWKQRLDICIGAARGLDYLHTGHRVIHRDVKASNILLDEGCEAQVSDFGLAKHEDRDKLQSHVSTKVKGTNGYLDPHYFHTSKLSRKSDTYAFGVVMLEMLCGRPAVDLRVSEDEMVLTRWARDKIYNGLVDEIVCSSLRDEISPNSLNTFVEVAVRCLHDEPKNRPTMSQVVLQLECALDQQHNNRNLVLNEISNVSDAVRLSTSNDEIVVYGAALPNMSLTTTNSKDVSAERTKPSIILPWEAFWYKVKPSKKSEVLSSSSEVTNIKLAKFDWNKIAAATNNFSASNIIGSGFGSLYKAVLPAGQVVAVKMLSKYSKQGPKEFKNEIGLLPNLQHPNIIKPLGYCVRNEEKLLVYEFTENRSLDTFLEMPDQCLQWPLRFKIITGIAKGLVYLHQDSGLGVIYTGLKSSNILLDIEMNPRISVFGTARTMLEHQSEPISITYSNYSDMPPEYLRRGRLCLKSDVYSFGMVVLELVSGRKRINKPHPDMSLPQYVWELWSEGKALDLVDKSLGGAFPVDEALRCIHVGLLCRQEQPDHRPPMRCVLKMLEGDKDEQLVEPQEPWPPAPVWTL